MYARAFRTPQILLLCLCLMHPLAARAQPAFQVKDINTTVPLTLPFTGEFAEAAGVAFFAVSDGLHGTELWRSDGTAAGTFLLGDLCPGICSSNPRSLTAFGSRVFFLAEDGLGRSALWSSDGTAAGTSLFLSDAPLQMTAAVGSLFLVRTTAVAGTEIWRSDGTVEGTVLLKDIWPGAGSSDPVFLGGAGSVLFFTATDLSFGREIWKTEGSEASTVLVADAIPGPQGFPAEAGFTVSGERIFLATTDGELWVSDGSGPGTVLVKSGLETPFDLFPSSAGIVFSTLGQAFGSSILWASDGTEAGTIQLLSSGCIFTCSPTWDDLVSSGGQIFFSNLDEQGIELWKTDGTPAGTVLVKDIHPTFSSLDFRGASLTAFAEGILFFADDGTHGAEVWKSDGTEAGTVLVADLEPGAGGSIGGTDTQIPHPDRPLHGVVTADNWLFLARTSAEGWSLWKTDGTQAGTGLVFSIDAQTPALSPDTAGYPKNRSFGGLSDVLLFHASDGTEKNGLWRSDGSPDGTSLLRGLPYSPPRTFTVAGGNVYFIWNTDFFLPQVWKSDGTQPSLVPAGPYRNPAQLTALGGSLFFSADHPGFPLPPTLPPGNYLYRTSDASTNFSTSHPGPTQLTRFGNRLVFKSNGTYWFTDEAGTTVSPLDSPAGGSAGISSRDLLAAAGNNLFLLVTDSTFGRELWKIDIAGTFSMIKDIRPGSASSFDQLHQYVPGDFAAAGGRLFFAADDGTSGRELWVSNGTAAGTFRLADLRPGAASSEPAWLTAAGKLVYFVADDGVHGRELWVTDGTSAGTRLVEDIHPGAGSSWPQHLAWRRHTLLFAADDGVHGFEPWVSDGTAATTFLLQDIAPDALPSSPLEFTETGTFLYFAATDGTHGRELWALPKSVVGSRFADATRAHWAWAFIEALAASGFTGGCGSEIYCPEDAVTRAQMAVFLLRGTRGSDFVPPPATGTVFTDIPAGYWAASWIEQLAADGLTGGCSASPPRYCPDNGVTRAEMAVFLLRAKHGPAYTPPPATGTVFTDVPAGFWAASWIEQLAAEGITGGCAPGLYCPGRAVTRAEMAVFLVRTFELPLPRI